MQSYGAPKSWKSQLWEFRDSHLGVPGQNVIWMWASWRGTKYTIREKVVASPKFGMWWVLWVRIFLWLVLTPKCFNYALTNLLFGLCRPVWINKMIVNLLSPIPEFQHALQNPKVLWAKECPNSLFFRGSNSHLSLLRSLGAHHL